LKIYLASGVPVILTDVPWNAQIIEEKECGIIVGKDKDEISRAVINLMKNEKLLEKFRYNAVEYSKEFDWNRIFSENLERILVKRQI